ncbi:MAG: hypothetical protein ABIO45_11485 [Burkholderiaceae bacterium]
MAPFCYFATRATASMRTSDKTFIDLETKFWQSMVDHDTDAALGLLQRASRDGQPAR